MIFYSDIKKMAKDNKAFRRVLETGKNLQLAFMSLKRSEDIGEEVHVSNDQLYYIIDGKGEATLDAKTEKFEKGDAFFVPAGVKHNLRNTTNEELKILTLYGPPLHAAGVVQTKKEELIAAKK